MSDNTVAIIGGIVVFIVTAALTTVVNPRRACARVTVVSCVYVSLCIRLFPLWLLQRPLKPANNGTHGFLLGFSWIICVEFRKNLPLKSYGVKKPICK